MKNDKRRAKRRRILTDRKIAKWKVTKRTELPDGLVPGLVFRATPSGTRTWVLRYRPAPGTRDVPVERFVLGDYTTLTLAAARKEAQKVRRRVDAGENPAAEKREAREDAARAGDTVADLAKDYITRHAKKHKRSWKDDDRMLNAEILPQWKTRKVKELTRRDVRELVEAIADRGSPITANRCLALIRKMLNFGIERDWLEANVASLIAKPGAEHSRDRVLTDEEIRLVWTACETKPPALCALMKLRLVTAQRGGELAQIRWTDIAGSWLTVPPTVAKNKLAHRVFLTQTAQGLIAELPRLDGCEFIFAGRGSNRPVSRDAVKKTGRSIAASVLAELQKAGSPNIKQFDFRGHDLRRTASTKMAEAGISRADISRVLNHAEGGPRATQVYDRYQGDREKQIALETWERRLLAILEQKAAGKVVAFG